MKMVCVHNGIRFLVKMRENGSSSVCAFSVPTTQYSRNLKANSVVTQFAFHTVPYCHLGLSIKSIQFVNVSTQNYFLMFTSRTSSHIHWLRNRASRLAFLSNRSIFACEKNKSIERHCVCSVFTAFTINGISFSCSLHWIGARKNSNNTVFYDTFLEMFFSLSAVFVFSAFSSLFFLWWLVVSRVRSELNKEWQKETTRQRREIRNNIIINKQ